MLKTPLILKTLLWFCSAWLVTVNCVMASAPTKSLITFTAEEQAWIAKHPEITIAFIDDLPPSLIKNPDGSYSGFVADHAQLLSEHTGIDFQVRAKTSWTELLASAKKRDVDILGVITPQVEHTNHFDFTLPITKTRTHIFGPSHTHIPNQELSDLAGKRIGYKASFKYITNYIDAYPEIDFIPIESSDALITALDNTSIDYILHSEWFEYLLRNQGISNYKPLLEIPELEITATMAVRNDWPILTRIINKVLSANGDRIREIHHYWLDFTKSIKIENKEIQLTEAEQDWLAKHPDIRFSLDPEWAPIEFTDDKAQPQGVSFEYLKRIEEILDVNFNYIPLPSWNNAYEAVASSELDILPSIMANEERRKRLNFTAPYFSIPTGIFSATDRAYVGGVSSLYGKKVVVVEGNALQAWIKQNHPKLDITSAPTIETALRKVANGHAFAFIGALISTSYYIGHSGLNKIKVIGETDFNYDLSIGVRKDKEWEPFIPILQKALNTFSPSEKEAIYNKWISIEYKHSVDYTLFLQGAFIAICTFLIFLYWNWRLRKEIIQRGKVENALLASIKGAKEATEAARQASQVKSAFLANMSHEIRTPMNAIVGAGQLLHQTNLNNEQHQYLDKLSYSSEVLLATIDNILDFSKAEAGKLAVDTRCFSINEVLNKIQQTCSQQADAKSLTLITQLDPNIPATLMGDEKKLTQILLNLVANGIKFTKQGQVEVLVDLKASDQSCTHLQFSVRDTGIGINADNQKALFQPFSQADLSITRRYGGTGLGLAISQQLAHLLGGQILVNSQPNKGSTFSFQLSFESCSKADHDKLTSAKISQPITATPKLYDVRILLVDDDEINRFLTKSYLLKIGVHVILASNGFEAIDSLGAQEIDLILMDIQMPIMDGYETTRKIRNELMLQNIPIIALTADALSTHRDRCLEAGMSDYLTKPFELKQLQEKILLWTCEEP